MSRPDPKHSSFIGYWPVLKAAGTEDRPTHRIYPPEATNEWPSISTFYTLRHNGL